MVFSNENYEKAFPRKAPEPASVPVKVKQPEPAKPGNVLEAAETVEKPITETTLDPVLSADAGEEGEGNGTE